MHLGLQVFRRTTQELEKRKGIAGGPERLGPAELRWEPLLAQHQQNDAVNEDRLSPETRIQGQTSRPDSESWPRAPGFPRLTNGLCAIRKLCWGCIWD